MIITPETEREYLYNIQLNNFPKKELLPTAVYGEIHHVDLSTRTIDSPEFLSVLKDHKSENVYFSVKRYMDYMDLAETVCLIQYKTANGKAGIYTVPFYDLTTLNKPDDQKILFSWVVDGLATSCTGPVEYAMRFYRVNLDTKELVYNLSTLPAQSKVLYGLDVQDPEFGEDYFIEASVYDQIQAEFKKMRDNDLYWIEIK